MHFIITYPYVTLFNINTVFSQSKSIAVDSEFNIYWSCLASVSIKSSYCILVKIKLFILKSTKMIELFIRQEGREGGGELLIQFESGKQIRQFSLSRNIGSD